MRGEDILRWVNAAPFVPFRIRMNSGRTFDIRHPEMIKVGRTHAYVFSYSGNPDEPVELMQMIGLVLIETVEPLEAVRPV